MTAKIAEMTKLKRVLVIKLATALITRDNARRSVERADSAHNALCAKLVHGFPDEYDALYASAESHAAYLKSLV